VDRNQVSSKESTLCIDGDRLRGLRLAAAGPH
jgi:hypothetical protein